jgi:AcrR family transcriptional regulator
VGRSTFYAHFRDKEDLLLRGVAGIVHTGGAEMTANENTERRNCRGVVETVSTSAMFKHVQDNEPLRKIMYRRSQENAILEKGTAFLYGNIKTQLQQFMEAGQEPAVPISLLAHYLTGGLMSLVRWWTENDMPQSPTEMDALFQQIAMPGVWNALRKNTPPH